MSTIRESSPWLNSDQAAEYLGTSAWCVRKYAREGDLRSSRTYGPHGRLRFHREWLDEYLLSQESTPVHETPRVRNQPGSFALECPTLAEALRK